MLAFPLPLTAVCAPATVELACNAKHVGDMNTESRPSSKAHYLHSSVDIGWGIDPGRSHPHMLAADILGAGNLAEDSHTFPAELLVTLSSLPYPALSLLYYQGHSLQQVVAPRILVLKQICQYSSSPGRA